MSFCRKCGVELPEDAVFCTQCGTKVVQPAACQQPQPVYQQIQQVPAQIIQPEPRKPGRGFAIASMVLGVVGLCYAALCLLMSIAEPADGSILIVIAILGGMPLLSLIFSLIARRRGWKNGFSRAGMITSIIAFSFYAVVVTVVGFGSAFEMIENSMEYFI